ncbi:ATP synthase subunit I [Myxosarcina sp. GI1(2024)]
MSKALTWWELFQLSCQGVARNKSRIWKISLQQGQKTGGWVGSLLAIALMWWWNWKLLLATGVGIGMMLLAFLVQARSWQQHWARWQRVLSGLNRKLIVAVSSGSFAAFGIYLAACIWANSENRWLAVGCILEGFASLITLLLLVWSVAGNQERYREDKWEKLEADLTHSQPLKRLIAIRQLTRLLRTKGLPPECSRHCSEYYRLMLSQNQVPIVRQALIDSLEQLEINTTTWQESTSLKLSLRLPTNFLKELDSY